MMLVLNHDIRNTCSVMTSSAALHTALRVFCLGFHAKKHNQIGGRHHCDNLGKTKIFIIEMVLQSMTRPDGQRNDRPQRNAAQRDALRLLPNVPSGRHVFHV
jgi:hypothetical protein